MLTWVLSLMSEFQSPKIEMHVQSSSSIMVLMVPMLSKYVCTRKYPSVGRVSAMVLRCH